MGYATLSNTITTAFSAFAATNSYNIRFDNDPRDTPDAGWWLQVSMGFEGSSQKETAPGKYRITGNVKILIFDDIKKGSYQLYEIADKISSEFSGETLTSVILRAAQLQRVSRENNKAVLGMVIPYQYDF